MDVSATLTITFTSNYYVGEHIICYRLVGTIPYTCVPVSCGAYIPPATPPTCFLDIPVTVACGEDLAYEGYVYPTCAVTEQEIIDSQTAFLLPFNIGCP